MAFIPLALTAVSAITGAVGAATTAGAQQQAAEYQAQVARNNQIIAQNNAKYEVQKGEVATQQEGEKNKALIATELTSQGASGIDVDSGSPLSVRRSSAFVGSQNQQTVMNNANRMATGYIQQASNYGAQASLADMQASSAGTAGLIGAASSLAGGAASFSSKWSNYSNTGLITG